MTTTPRNARVASWYELELLDNRFPALHGLRVLAIVTVVQWHLTAMFRGHDLPISPFWIRRSLSIFFGMDLFFVLSGFLIGSILFRSMEAPETPYLRRFYARRVCRTFPSYYVVLTILALTTALTSVQRDHLASEYFYLTNFHTIDCEPHRVLMPWGWSLAIEEQFYLLVPLLVFVLQKRKSDGERVLLLTLLWSSALAVRLFIYFAGGPWTYDDLRNALYFSTYTRFDTLVAGVLLAFVYKRWKEPIAQWLESPFRRVLLALLTAGCLALLLLPGLFGQAHVNIFHVFAWGTLTTIMYFAGLLLLLLSGGGWVHSALARPMFRQIATLGYGVYLVHVPVLDHVVVPVTLALANRRAPLLLNWMLALAVLMGVSLVLAYAMHVLVEKPMLRLRDRVAA